MEKISGRDSIRAKDIFLTILRKEQFLNLPMYFFVLIPLVVLLAKFASKIDRKLNFPPLIIFPYNLILFLSFVALGILIVWWAYGYLVLLGEGSPAPHLGGTKKLVTIGPYALIRHPSVIGKLLGVIGFGFLFQSTIFIVVFIPILFIYSVLYNRFIQERFCVKKFGVAYLKYRKEVPMFFPKVNKLKEFIRKRGGRDV